MSVLEYRLNNAELSIIMIEEKINDCIKRLKESSKNDVLNVAEFLLSKIADRKLSSKYGFDWNDFSLTMALLNIEEVTFPTYSLSDLKVVFSQEEGLTFN